MKLWYKQKVLSNLSAQLILYSFFTIHEFTKQERKYVYYF